ncbi:hypothetical protein B0H13DRAFT_2231593 [Mycena leptocephala]|nr:hypothetical protein B0H13DRAFT_2231593 [Mycena leptocephala]
MKISIRSPLKYICEIDVELTDLIGAIKSKIEQSQGHAPSSQKIILSGKVLENDKTLESYGFREGTDYLVLLVPKPKPTPTPMSSTSTPVAAAHSSATATPSAPSLPSQTPILPSQTRAKRALSPDTASSSTTNVTSKKPKLSHAASLSGPSPPTSASEIHPVPQSTISNMVDMGFERDQVLRALRASYNDPDRAVEYLMTVRSLPITLPVSHLEAETAAALQVSSGPAPATDPPQNLFQPFEQQQQLGADSGAATGSGTPPVGSSRDTQFQQFRQRLMQNPEPFLQFLAVQNPRMAQALATNPELLVQLLAAAGDSEGEGGSLPGAQVINDSRDDRAAIERLEALGFPRPAVIEAYLACDKNEELAVNYLLENGSES